LILGETGTGKELIARAIHAASARNARALVKLNCSAISAGLVESELFGHVKGAFTGASERRTGRFELADGGTLFLDELGELPLETQAKLLRVLQEGEFEPVGSSRTQKVDVRVIAATNRDLAADVEAGRFRADLYYRLHVFPVEVPALRQRRDDIPPLAAHFLELAGRRCGRRFTGIEAGTLARLQSHDWPGNIRDLQNTIERAAILSTPPLLSIDWELGPARSPVRQLAPPSVAPESGTDDALEAVERQHIIDVLRRTRGVIEGPNGAATLLGLKPSTARFRMKKLGISKADFGSH
jgi:formate hydrogenlyase transcriptional activator